MRAAPRMLGVTCLSANPPENNMPMWAYYANNGKGFCIEYRVENAKQIHMVSYEPKRIPIASILIDSFRETGDTNNVINTALFIQQLFMKHESWSHEEEYRFVCPLPVGHPGCKVEAKGAGLKVERIIAGKGCSEEHMRRLNEISNQLGCGDIYRVELSEDSFISIVRR